MKPEFPIFVILPAAGSSSRMGGGRSKILQELAGKTVLQRILATLGEVSGVMKIIIATTEDLREEISKFEELESSKIDLLEGGASRQESVRLALEALIKAVGAEQVQSGVVVVHDAARPLVSAELFERVIAAAAEKGAATAVVPVVDSLIGTTEGTELDEVVERERFRAVQTPQAFRGNFFMQAHLEAADNTATDDASLVKPYCKVTLVEGERNNFKLTYPEDFVRARILLGEPQRT